MSQMFSAVQQQRFLTRLGMTGSSTPFRTVSPVLRVPRGHLIPLDHDFSSGGIIKDGLILPGLVVGTDRKNQSLFICVIVACFPPHSSCLWLPVSCPCGFSAAIQLPRVRPHSDKGTFFPKTVFNYRFISIISPKGLIKSEEYICICLLTYYWLCNAAQLPSISNTQYGKILALDTVKFQHTHETENESPCSYTSGSQICASRCS